MSFIEFKHIGKKYAGAEHKSVDDFNLNIEEKEFIAFVGPVWMWKIHNTSYDCRIRRDYRRRSVY